METPVDEIRNAYTAKFGRILPIDSAERMLKGLENGAIAMLPFLDEYRSRHQQIRATLLLHRRA
jgi:hypothetical protein